MPRWKDAGWERRSLSPQVEALMMLGGSPDVWCYQKDVGDGHLSVLVGPEAAGFHLSISHRVDTPDGKTAPGRYPTWDEILEAREFFTNPQVAFVMHLPTKEEYVNVHETTFHLWEAKA